MPGQPKLMTSRGRCSGPVHVTRTVRAAGSRFPCPSHPHCQGGFSRVGFLISHCHGDPVRPPGQGLRLPGLFSIPARSGCFWFACVTENQ